MPLEQLLADPVAHRVAAGCSAPQAGAVGGCRAWGAGVERGEL